MTERAPPRRSAISKGGRITSPSLARAHRRRCEVAARAGGGVPGEVLERRHDARVLEAAHVGRADGPHEVGVFADGLLGAAPAVVAGDVEDRGEPLVDPGGTHGLTDLPGHLGDERGVEGRPPRQRHRIGGRLPGCEAGEALFVDLRGDAEAAGRHDLLLRGGERPGTGDRVHGDGAEGPGQLSEAVLDERVPRWDVLRQVGLVRCDASARGVGPDPDAYELRDLLLEGHHGDERRGPLGRCEPGVPPRGVQLRGACGCPGCLRGHATPRRRSRRRAVARRRRRAHHSVVVSKVSAERAIPVET